MSPGPANGALPGEARRPPSPTASDLVPLLKWRGNRRFVAVNETPFHTVWIPPPPPPIMVAWRAAFAELKGRERPHPDRGWRRGGPLKDGRGQGMRAMDSIAIITGSGADDCSLPADYSERSGRGSGWQGLAVPRQG